ncbi:MAG: hypothetical protein ACP5NW_05765 [Candidatus Woesearchaeota archaeon]
MIIRSTVRFIDSKSRSKFYRLENGDASERQIFKYILRAKEDMKQNAFCGIPISKKLMPDKYKKLGIDNLWKYDLPNGWRLVYTIASPNKIELVTIIIEWFDHKNYEKRFNYLL